MIVIPFNPLRGYHPVALDVDAAVGSVSGRMPTLTD